MFGLNNESTQILINAIKTALYDEGTFLSSLINWTGLIYFVIIAVGVTMFGHVYRLIFRLGGLADVSTVGGAAKIGTDSRPDSLSGPDSAWGGMSVAEQQDAVRRTEEAFLRGD